MKRSWKRHERETCDAVGRKRRQTNSCLGLWAENAELYSAVIRVTSQGVDLHANSSTGWPAGYAFRLIPVGVIPRRRLLNRKGRENANVHES